MHGSMHGFALNQNTSVAPTAPCHVDVDQIHLDPTHACHTLEATSPSPSTLRLARRRRPSPELRPELSVLPQ